jgi:hypothetical protein
VDTGCHSETEEQISRLLMSKNSEEAAAVALQTYGPQVLGFLAAILIDPKATESAFRRSAEALFGRLPEIQPAHSYRTEAIRVAWQADRDPKTVPPGGNPTARKLADQVRSRGTPKLGDPRVAKLRDKLSVEERAVLVLRLDLALAWPEVAYVLGVDEPTARARFDAVLPRVRDLAAT